MSREGSRDEPSQEMVMLCKLIAESQGEMLQKLAESKGDMLQKLTESQGDMLQKLTESQGDMLQKLTESQERSQQKLLETVTTNFNKGLEKVLGRHTGEEEESEDETDVEEKPKNDADKNNDNIVDEYEGLYNAAYEGDWRKARDFLKRYLDAVQKTITFDDETALHIAINNERWSFAQELVKLMTPEALEMKDNANCTALHGAALYGNIKTAEAIVRKNPKLTQMRDDEDLIPLETAIIYISTGQKETVKYLYSVTKHEHPSPFSDTHGAELLCSAIQYGFYHLALSLVKRFPKLVTKKTEGTRGICGLQKLIDRPFAFKSGANFPWWERFVYSLIHVDMSSPYDKDTEEVDDNSLKNSEGTNEIPLESTDGQGGDLENPSEITKVKTEDEVEAAKKVSDATSTNENGVTRAVKNFISNNIIPYYARAPLVSRLYDQKVMHKRAVNLVNYMVEQLKKEKSTNQNEVIDFLNDTAIVNTAIEYGITEFVGECLEKFRFVIWYKFGGETMIQIAIKQRDEKILNLILETSGNDRDDLVSREDVNYNSILHYAANLAPSAKLNLVSGAALQMQREIQWFKGIENIVHPQYKYTRNGDKETAKSVFTGQHKELVEKGEKWMKDTSGSCMVVATLIATVAFAGAFTVPGALFSSIMSVLMFLAIMTSRYAEEDFYKSLPQKLIIGLATLFISMASILISFGAAFTIVLRQKYSWATFPVASFGLVSVLLFAFLEFPLFLEMVYFTYSPRIFGNKNQYVPNKKKTTKLAKEIEAKKEVLSLGGFHQWMEQYLLRWTVFVSGD
ncbi:hypothetical protein C5167_034677 [Papaver somniferum]|uniref:PGG domain-containing protein n=1 Tax=Papaver somniferum TaxID=3469 RepID=A0A4Y7KF87_PAPSO|nr:hypothetical protein C5167_034677 [Papaver somniferum]